MKRCIAAMLAVILSALLLASCKGKNAPPGPVAETSPESATATAPQEPSTEPPTASPPEQSPDTDMTIPDNKEITGLWARIDGSTATIPLTAALYDLISGGDWPPVHETTPMAYEKLINGNADLIFVTYPSQNEFDMAREKGVELEIIPVTKDALVFLVNVENPVDNVSLSQLRSVYTGSISAWDELGGIREGIIAYQRTADSGSQTLFLKLVMDGLAPMSPPSEWIPEAMGILVDSISDYDNSEKAIGYSMFYYVNNMYGNSRFKLLGIDGVAPTRETITRGEYPLEDYYYAVMRKDTPAGSPARTLVDWLLTDEGQTLAVRAGYIPLHPIDGVSPDGAIDPVYLGDTENSSGTGGTVLKTGVEDIQPVNGVRPPLSDVFYDGFNYVQYINSEILAQFNWVDMELRYQVTWGENHQKRPFTGIPNDYPNYEINFMGALFISFPKDNPFFGSGSNFYIRLTEDISPYGEGKAGYSVTYDSSRRILPKVRLYTVNISLPEKPDVSARINEQLKTWTDSFPIGAASVELLDSFTSWYWPTSDDEWEYRLQPIVGIWRDYLSVSYCLQTYDGPSVNLPMVYTICFNTKTGSVVDLPDVLPTDLDYSKASVYTIMDFNDLGEFGYPNQISISEYSPAKGSVMTRAWLTSNGLGIYMTEPGGRVLQIMFWADWE